MSSLVTEQGILHFETMGRGQPLIFLHCWLGSWDFWRSTMEAIVSQSSRWRLHALDFWGFGESDKRLPTYRVEDYVSMVVQFMDQMGIDRAPVFGHSMGGSVAMSLALQHPTRVEKVVVVGSPMDGRSLSLLLKVAGVRWIADILWRFPPLLQLTMWGYSPFLARDRREVYRRVMHTISLSTVESFSTSIGDLRRTNLVPRLPQVQAPVLAVYGVADWVVHPNQAQVIAEAIPHAWVELFEGSGHFPMLDEPQRFNRALLRFLTAEGAPMPAA